MRRNNPRSALLVAGALVAGALMGTPVQASAATVRPSTASAAATVEAPPAPEANLRIMSLNVCYCLNASDWAADAVRATQFADVVAFQEASETDDRAAMIKALNARGWIVFVPKTGGTENPIAFKAKRFSFVTGRIVQTHGAIAGVTPARYINTAILKDKASGKLFAVVNTHTISEAARQGGQTPSWRRPYLELHLKKMYTEIVAARPYTSYIFATGDLNVNYLQDRLYRQYWLPTRTLGGLMNFTMPLTPSMANGALYDYVMSAKTGAQPQLVSSWIQKDFKSDHWGVVSAFYIPGLSPACSNDARTFCNGMVNNIPTGTTAQRRAVLDLYTKIINATPVGGAVHLTTTQLDDPAITQALLNAKARGTFVQLVFRNQGTLTYREQALMRMLGSNLALRTWAATCTTVECQAEAAGMSASTLLVNKAGDTSALRVGSTQALLPNTAQLPSRANVTTDLTSYDVGFAKFFALVGQ